MNKKTTLSQESYELYSRLVRCCERTTQGSKYYEKLKKLTVRAGDRNNRRHKKELREGVTVVNKVGRPKKEDKKVQLGVKLPPYLIEWLKRQPESNAELIEKALCEYYQIPEHLKK